MTKLLGIIIIRLHALAIKKATVHIIDNNNIIMDITTTAAIINHLKFLK